LPEGYHRAPAGFNRAQKRTRFDGSKRQEENRMRALPKLTAIVLLALGADAVAQTPSAPLQTMSLHASVVTHPAPFKKYLYSFPLPAKVAFRGLSGSVSTSQMLAGFSEALISVHELPSGRCPQNGEVYDTYEEIGKKYPGYHSLANFIVKNAHGGVSSVATRFTLPQGIPMQNCVVVILDGSILTGGAFTMTSDMTMTYATGAPSPPPHIIGLDDEFCFGQSWGCQLHSVDTARSFAKIVEIPAPVRLLALYGDLSDSTFTPGGNFAPPPRGAWGMSNDFIIVRDCAKLPKGLLGPGNFYAQIPGSSLLNVTLHGNGQGTLQQPVFKEFDTVLQAGDCIAHLIKMTGVGGVDAEDQVFALVAPL
jgi:hypothetical protein